MLISRCDPAQELWELEPLRHLNSIIERRIGKQWILLANFSESLRTYSLGFCVELREEPPDESLATLSLTPDGMRLSLSWKELSLGNPSAETIIPMDISMISIFSFQNPKLVIEEGLASRILFYANPAIWSDPSLVGVGISSAYERLSEELGLGRRYESFARALLFLCGIEHIPEIMKAFMALSSLGISPPISKAELLHTPDLSPAEMKVLRALCIKEAIDRIPNLSDRQMASLLSDLIGLPSAQRARLQRSLSSRGLREGLTLTELSLVTGIDKAYLWRYVIPGMTRGCLLTAERDSMRGKEVRVYRPNTHVTFVSDLILTYGMRISSLLSRIP
ncbi:MAG: hypothetical protein BA066_01100 [Candidatus Korarchaeota archaeon NZ13-K]|nr:MAG: hypothetical protein BA066_01100 [Candidatus Korarchaeota archaeon NZ13-K]